MRKIYYADEDQLTKNEKTGVALYLLGLTIVLSIVTGTFIGTCLREQMSVELQELQKQQPTIEYFTD